MLTSAEHEIVQEPSMAKSSSPSKAPKYGAQRQCELTEREKCSISRRKTPDQRPLQLRTPKSRRHPNLHHRHHVTSLRW